MEKVPQDRLIESLAQRIREIEQKEHEAVCSEVEDTPLGQILPAEVLRGGSLVELLSKVQGAGGWTLALLLAKQACGERKALVVVDGRKCFYPPAACRLGIDLERTIVVHAACGLASRAKLQVLPAIVQSLRCPAVGGMISWFERLPSLDFRRLQLAAEAGGGLGLLLRPASALREPSFAAARLLITPIASGKRNLRRMQIDFVRLRGNRAGQSMIVEVDDETGDVHLPSQLAVAKTRRRASG